MYSNLAYPDILEAYQSKLHPPNQSKASREKSNTSTNTSNASNASNSNSSVVSAAVADVYETWYPPMRSTLSLLSKLYGVVEMAVFEDFARRAIGITYIHTHTYIHTYNTYIIYVLFLQIPVWAFFEPAQRKSRNPEVSRHIHTYIHTYTYIHSLRHTYIHSDIHYIHTYIYSTYSHTYTHSDIQYIHTFIQYNTIQYLQCNITYTVHVCMNHCIAATVRCVARGLVSGATSSDPERAARAL